MQSISKELEIKAEEYRDIWKSNVHKLIEKMNSELKVSNNSIILLAGSEGVNVNDEDTEYVDFYQNGHFMYLFGLEERNCYGAIEIDSGKQIIFIPRLSEDYKMWMIVRTKQEFQQLHKFDEVYYVDELPLYINQIKPNTIYVNNGVNSDSHLNTIDLKKILLDRLNFDISQFNVNYDDLFEILCECRVIKSDQEIKLMKWITQLSCEAHVFSIQNTKVGMKEYQIPAMFISYINNNCKGVFGYQPICASGTNASVLHYIENDKTINDGQLILSDLGAKWKGYVSDITVTYPSNGEFSLEQAQIYNAVLDARNKVISQCKAGVEWDKMHELAERTILSHLQSLKILLPNFSLDELFQSRIGAIFFPHGLGHLIGLAVHDVGGYGKCCPPRRNELGFSKLRTRRTLENNMCLTIEPGCYFIPHFIHKAKADNQLSQYIDWNVLQLYQHLGGVRIEDDVYITHNGCVNMSQDLPRTIQQIQLCMANKEWKQ